MRYSLRVPITKSMATLIDHNKLLEIAAARGMQDPTALHFAAIRKGAKISRDALRQALKDGSGGGRTLRALSLALDCTVDDLLAEVPEDAADE